MNKIPNLFVLLKERNVSRKELCSAIGVTNSNITGWKNGDYAPSIDVVIQIAHYFNVSTDYLLGVSDTKKPASDLTPDEETLLSAFRSLTPDQQSTMLTMMTALAAETAAREKERRSV